MDNYEFIPIIFNKKLWIAISNWHLPLLLDNVEQYQIKISYDVYDYNCTKYTPSGNYSMICPNDSNILRFMDGMFGSAFSEQHGR